MKVFIPCTEVWFFTRKKDNVKKVIKEVLNRMVHFKTDEVHGSWEFECTDTEYDCLIKPLFNNFYGVYQVKHFVKR